LCNDAAKDGLIRSRFKLPIKEILGVSIDAQSHVQEGFGRFNFLNFPLSLHRNIVINLNLFLPLGASNK